MALALGSTGVVKVRRIASIIVLILAGSLWPAVPGFASGSTVAQSTPAARLQADFNNDGADDLAVGVPEESVAGHIAAGVVEVLPGSTTGSPAPAASCSMRRMNQSHEAHHSARPHYSPKGTSRPRLMQFAERSSSHDKRLSATQAAALAGAWRASGSREELVPPPGSPSP
jgi:hypothetical protein